MKKFVEKLIDEHSQLYVRIEKLHKTIYEKDTSHINKADFANMCIQLAAMRQYEKCLVARLLNNNITFSDGVYHEAVAVITKDDVVPTYEENPSEDNKDE